MVIPNESIFNILKMVIKNYMENTNPEKKKNYGFVTIKMEPYW